MMMKEKELKTAEEIKVIEKNVKNVFGKNLVPFSGNSYYYELERFLEDDNRTDSFWMNSYIPQYKDTNRYNVNVYELTKMPISVDDFVVIYSRRFNYEMIKPDDYRDVFLGDKEYRTEAFGLYSFNSKKFYAINFEAMYCFGNLSYASSIDKKVYPDWYIPCTPLMKEDTLTSFIKNKICYHLEKDVFPDIKSLDDYSEKNFGEKIEISSERINEDIKKYTMNNSTPDVNDYIEGYFNNNNIELFDIIYQMEYPEKFISMLIKRLSLDDSLFFVNFKSYYLVKEKLAKGNISLTLEEFLKKEIIMATNQIEAKNVKLEIICKEDNFSYKADKEYKEKNVNKCIEASYPREYLNTINGFYLNSYRLFNFSNPIRKKYSRNINIGIDDLRLEDILSISFRNKKIYSLIDSTEKYKKMNK